MHAQEVVELILKQAGEDVLKQIELAAAVNDRLTDVNPNKDLPVALAILESVKSWLKEIKNKFKGRFPNDIRSLYQGVHQAVSLADAKRSDVARLARHVESPLEGRPRSLFGLHRGQSQGPREVPWQNAERQISGGMGRVHR